MKSVLVNKRTNVQGYKHDGTMHRIWNSVFVVEENEEYIAVASIKTKVIENNLRFWFTKEPAVMIFFKKRWYNVIAMIKNDGITYYVNLASPYVIDNYSIKYIDYDLDLKLFPNDGIKLIDVKEYSFHKEKYKYGDDIDKILKFNIKEIEDVMKKRIFPFNDSEIIRIFNLFNENRIKKRKEKENE